MHFQTTLHSCKSWLTEFWAIARCIALTSWTKREGEYPSALKLSCQRTAEDDVADLGLAVSLPWIIRRPILANE